MKCPVCKNGELFDNVTDYQTKFKGEYVLVKNVPVQECNVCGEQIMSYETIKKVEDMFLSKKSPVGYVEVAVFDMAV
jgi:YgiT-type zinc finger domain-containing protein